VSSFALADAPRRALSDRQARTVARLADAAVVELAATGYAGLTVRGVARRAGVAPATAYTYFASKEHLVAEVYWRRYRDQPATTADRRRSRLARVVEVLEGFALVVADEAELSAACTVAVLADDPEVRVLRERIGAELHRRLLAALGDDADAATVEALQFVASGVLLQIGTGHLTYEDLPEVLARVAGVVVGGEA
jgi:TetR/AcrR family transcriptional regulator, cholesterol catabolism regulator